MDSKQKPNTFQSRCYKVLKSVPRGKVTTYSAIAKALRSKAYRAVGTAMRNNRDPKIPCHRVVLSDGRVGNYNRGKSLKIRILKSEGIKIKEGKVDLSIYSYRFR
jgi:methylated-DNA-[protein]-cysteine S-methyltransferase